MKIPILLQTYKFFISKRLIHHYLISSNYGLKYVLSTFTSIVSNSDQPKQIVYFFNHMNRSLTSVSDELFSKTTQHCWEISYPLNFWSEFNICAFTLQKNFSSLILYSISSDEHSLWYKSLNLVSLLSKSLYLFLAVSPLKISFIRYAPKNWC